LTTQEKSDCITEYRNGKKTTIARWKIINQDSDGNEERRKCPWNINLSKKNVLKMKRNIVFGDSVGHSRPKGQKNQLN
jgi:hypothetical protein